MRLCIKRHFQKEMHCFSLKNRVGAGLRKLRFLLSSFVSPSLQKLYLLLPFFSFTLNRYYFYVNKFK